MKRRTLLSWLFGFPVIAAASESKVLARVVPVGERESCLISGEIEVVGEWVPLPPPSPADQPVTRAELAAILKEAGFMYCGYPDSTVNDFQSVFDEKDHPAPAFQRLLQQVDGPGTESARANEP